MEATSASVFATDNRARVPVVIKSDICGSPELIQLFDGHRTLGEISSACAYEPDELEDFVATNLSQGYLAWKDEWSPLFWCDTCDLPLLSTGCDVCGARAARRIDLKFPCNPRPLLPHDEAMLRAVGMPWPMSASLILNSYKHPDYWGWELIHGGRHIGDIVQRHENGTFELIPTPDFRPEALTERSATLDDLIRANASRLKYLEQEAVAFMNSFKPTWKIVVPTLGFSGGKDSVVLAHLTSLTRFRKLQVYQINTGIEPEYNETFSDKFLASYKCFTVHKMFSRDIFWRSIRKLGPHALDFQWCRTILKNLAFYRRPKDLPTRVTHFLGRFVRPQVLILNGARNREEPERVALARSLQLTGSHPTMPNATVTTLLPLALYTDLDVWMYIHQQGLPVNPAYTQDRGQRLLCMFCFEKNDHEFEIDMKAYPDVYKKLEGELVQWQKKFDFPDEWISKRLWRYNESNSKYMKKLKILPRVDTVVQELERAVTWEPATFAANRFAIRGRIQGEFQLRDLASWFAAFGKCVLSDERLAVKSDRANIITALGGDESDELHLSISADGAIDLVANDGELLKKFTRLVHGWTLIRVHCLQCGGCVKQTDNIVLDSDTLVVKKKLPLAAMETIFQSCPVHPDGLRNIQRPVTKEYTPTSCTSCFMKYKKDMSFIEPVEA